MLNTGELVELESTFTNGTESELKTSTTYAVAATSIGQFADGKTITSVINPISSDSSIAYAYVQRRGEILALLPVAVSGQVMHTGGAMGLTLQAADVIRVLTITTSSRFFAYSVMTNQGVAAIFTGTPSGAGNTDLQHLKAGTSLGNSLQGQRIVSHMATSVDGAKLSSGGVLILNDRGLPTGGIMAVNPQAQQPKMESAGGSAVGLNFIAR
ncbi:MAG: hypothetical protein ACPGGE_02010, partial [Poseidonia sp.]